MDDMEMEIMKDGDPDDIEMEIGEGWYFGDEQFFNMPPRSCTLMQEPGSSIIRIFDRENKDYVPVPDGNGGYTVDLAECEKLYVDFETAYKYRLTPDGKWGYISPKFAQILEPQYEDILVSGDGFNERIVAWSEALHLSDDDESRRINVEFSLNVTYKPSDEQDVWLPDMFFRPGNSFITTDRKYIPTASALLYHDGEADITLYRASSESNESVVIHPLPGTMPIHWTALSLSGTLMLLGNGTKIDVPCSDSDGSSILAACRRAFDPQPLDFEVGVCLAEGEYGVNTYVVRKDGWCAIAKVSVGETVELRELLTPYAFTEIIPAGFEGFARVDRFGRLGVFKLDNHRYVVPCEYEMIGLSTGAFTVHRAGFVGTIDTDGYWVTHLHREEE